jgi:hypothetical protein
MATCQNQRVDWGIAIPLILFCVFSALFSFCCDQLAARFSDKIRRAQATSEELVGGCQGFSISKKSPKPSDAISAEGDKDVKEKTN